MPLSSESDFEHFAQKIKKDIATKVKEIETQTADYVLKKENEIEHEIERWLKDAQNKWDQKRDAREQQNQNSIETEMNAQYSAFKKEQSSALRSALKVRLEEIFPTLAECFILQISQKYQAGTFIMPEAYMLFLTTEGFSLQGSEKEQVVFTSGNLYIEYSVERIMEELEEEILLAMGAKDEVWQK